MEQAEKISMILTENEAEFIRLIRSLQDSELLICVEAGEVTLAEEISRAAKLPVQ